DVDARTTVMAGLCFLQMTGRDLQRPAGGRKKPHASRPRVERGEVEVGAVLVGLATIEHGRLRLPAFAVNTTGHHAEGDVGRVEPVVRDGCERTGHRRNPVWKCCRAKGRLANRAAVHLRAHIAGEWTVVRRAELHEKIVRVLSIVNGLALTHLARRK